MSGTYTKRTEARGSGITPQQWIDRNLKKPQISGVNSQTVDGVDFQGNSIKIPIGNAGILFTNLNQVKQENRSNFKGSAPVTNGTPIAIVRLNEAYQAILLKTKFYKSFPDAKNFAVIPLYITDNKSDNIGRWKCISDQSFAQWTAIGDPYKINPDEQLNGHGWLCVLDSISMLMFQEDDKAKLKELAIYFCLTAQAADAHYKCFVDSFDVISPLRNSIDTTNNLQRALSFIFFDPADGEPSEVDEEKTPWDNTDMLHMFAKSLKKWRRWTPNNEVDIVKHPILGIMGIKFVPVLRNLVRGVINLDQAVKTFLDDSAFYLQVLADNINAPNYKRNITFLFELWNHGGYFKQYSRNMFVELYDHCIDKHNIDIPTPLADMGFIPKVVIPFEFKTDCLLKGAKNKSQSVLTAQSRKFKITSTNSAEWTGIRFFTEGTYIMKGNLVGGATVGKGNTAGQNNTVNVRFTTGENILPPRGDRTEGISSAGMHYGPPGWGYNNIQKTLDPLNEFSIVLSANQVSIYIGNNKNPWYTIARGHNASMLVGFKFVSFVVDFKDAKQQVVQKPKASVVVNSGLSEDADSDDDNDMFNNLTPTALIKKLAELSLKKKGNSSGTKGNKIEDKSKHEPPPAYD